MRKTRARREVVTLIDLAPKHDVKGGSLTRVFGAGLVGPPDPKRLAADTSKPDKRRK